MKLMTFGFHSPSRNTPTKTNVFQDMAVILARAEEKPLRLLQLQKGQINKGARVQKGASTSLFRTLGRVFE
ncbi:hypothetical protein JTE90_027283 [Oedothorax gibbosus]|uniref:Uncharacterized protein n=1 Tax=Oedothorax gibbosus TaxID=931172 RepID=A0AAV6W295_9ARAC|nr:hypothetical protein JTE90_027283 [Oedothorax gibbosus]